MSSIAVHGVERGVWFLKSHDSHMHAYYHDICKILYLRKTKN